MTDDEIKEAIKREEGLRLKIYRDTLNNLTVGYGHHLRVGSAIPQSVANDLLEQDLEKAKSDYDSLGLSLDAKRRAVIIKREKGLRLKIYRDTLNNLTVGYGHHLRVGSEIPQSVANDLFEQDFNKAISDYDSLGLSLDTGRRAVIIDMIFNIGIGGVQRFKLMLEYLSKQNYIQAAYELMESEYAKQVPERAKRNRDRILRGY